jgi:hypothetical protein
MRASRVVASGAKYQRRTLTREKSGGIQEREANASARDRDARNHPATVAVLELGETDLTTWIPSYSIRFAIGIQIFRKSNKS